MTLPTGWESGRVNISSFSNLRPGAQDADWHRHYKAWRAALEAYDGEVYHVELHKMVGRAHSVEFQGTNNEDAWALVELPAGLNPQCGMAVMAERDCGHLEVMTVVVSRRTSEALKEFVVEVGKKVKFPNVNEVWHG